MPISEFKKSFPAKTTIFSLGDEADSAYIVEKGSVEVSILKR